MEPFFSDVIRRARERRGMPMRVLASKMERTEGEISQWEIGRREPNERILLAVAAALEVSLAELFAEELATRPGFAASAKGATPKGGDVGAGFLGDCIRTARKAAGITEGELGRRCVPPMAQPRVAELEGGAESRARPGETKSRREATLQRVATALGLTLPDLIGQELVARGLLVRT